MSWTRLAKKRVQMCDVCLKEFYSIRSDARFCSARCRQAWKRSPEGILAKLKRLGQVFDKPLRQNALALLKPRSEAQARLDLRHWRRKVCSWQKTTQAKANKKIRDI
jgi:hypothetical protein